MIAKIKIKMEKNTKLTVQMISTLMSFVWKITKIDVGENVFDVLFSIFRSFRSFDTNEETI